MCFVLPIIRAVPAPLIRAVGPTPYMYFALPLIRAVASHLIRAIGPTPYMCFALPLIRAVGPTSYMFLCMHAYA